MDGNMVPLILATECIDVHASKDRTNHLCLVFHHVHFKFQCRSCTETRRSVIAFRFIPDLPVTDWFKSVWDSFVSTPWITLPRWIRLGIGWLCLFAIVLGSAFGFPLSGVRVTVRI
jgi:hypothetical protein